MCARERKSQINERERERDWGGGGGECHVEKKRRQANFTVMEESSE